MKRLDVDVGNSRIKWRLCELPQIGGGVLVQSKGEAGFTDYVDCLSSVVEGVPEKVYVSCVVPSIESEFREVCIALWGVAPIFVRVERHYAGVTNGYDDVSQMGVDRWLAMIAAYVEFRSVCLVIDVGTAPTIDLLLASGVHLGGYITPGFDLMKESLLSRTKIRDISSSNLKRVGYDHGVAVGGSTQQAISAGLCAMQVGLIRMAIDELMSVSVGKPLLIFSGGGSEHLSQMVEASLLKGGVRQAVGPIVLRPTLVLDGLSQFI